MAPVTNHKMLCTECGWHGLNYQLFIIGNPFNTNVIFACPACKRIQSCTLACDQPDCWEPVTCGTPTPEGYRSTCSAHKPEATE